MTQLYSRLVFLPFMLISAFLMLIHAQPYDDHELRTVLLPDGCPAPCFMGIRPGITTAKEALEILKQHKWVADIRVLGADNPYQIWWTWSKAAPDVLKSPPLNPEFPAQGELYAVGSLVSSIHLAPQLALGDMVVEWGLPAEAQIILGGLTVAPNPTVTGIAALPYQSAGFWVNGTTSCPYTANLWQTAVEVRITNQFYGLSTGAVFAINAKPFLAHVRETSNRMCGV